MRTWVVVAAVAVATLVAFAVPTHSQEPIRVGAVIEQVWRDGGRFDGWSEHFSYDRWVAACSLNKGS